MKISVVIPTFNEESNVNIIFNRIKEVFDELQLTFEVIFVDDGSSDGSREHMEALASRFENAQYISFSRNFGHQLALKAGMDFSRGDAIISMDCDMQHPPSVIPELINEWLKGANVVNTTRIDSSDTSFFKKLTSKMYYRILNSISDVVIQKGSADFRLMDRKVVETLKSLKEGNPFYRGLVPWVGFRQVSIQYEASERYSGTTKYTLSKMVKLALEDFTSFSIKPLRISTILGVSVSFLAFSYLLYALAQKIFYGHVIAGWTSVLVSILFIGGVQLIMIGILGEYLGKLFKEAKGRPQYIVNTTSFSID